MPATRVPKGGFITHVSNSADTRKHQVDDVVDVARKDVRPREVKRVGVAVHAQHIFRARHCACTAQDTGAAPQVQDALTLHVRHHVANDSRRKLAAGAVLLELKLCLVTIERREPLQRGLQLPVFLTHSFPCRSLPVDSYRICASQMATRRVKPVLKTGFD